MKTRSSSYDISSSSDDGSSEHRGSSMDHTATVKRVLNPGRALQSPHHQSPTSSLTIEASSSTVMSSELRAYRPANLAKEAELPVGPLNYPDAPVRQSTEQVDTDCIYMDTAEISIQKKSVQDAELSDLPPVLPISQEDPTHLLGVDDTMELAAEEETKVGLPPRGKCSKKAKRKRSREKSGKTTDSDEFESPNKLFKTGAFSSLTDLPDLQPVSEAAVLPSLDRPRLRSVSVKLIKLDLSKYASDEEKIVVPVSLPASPQASVHKRRLISSVFRPRKLPSLDEEKAVEGGEEVEDDDLLDLSGDEDEVEILAVMKSTDWVDTNEQERSDFIANTEGENTIHYIGTILRNFFSKTFLFNSVNHF